MVKEYLLARDMWRVYAFGVKKHAFNSDKERQRLAQDVVTLELLLTYADLPEIEKHVSPGVYPLIRNRIYARDTECREAKKKKEASITLSDTDLPWNT